MKEVKEAETALVAERPPFLVAGSSAFGRELLVIEMEGHGHDVRCA